MNLSQIFNLQPGVYHVTGLPHNLDNLEQAVKTNNKLFTDDHQDSYKAVNFITDFEKVHLDYKSSEAMLGRTYNSLSDMSLAYYLMEVEDNESPEVYLFYPNSRMSLEMYYFFVQELKCIQKTKPNLTVYIFSYLPTDCENLNIDNL